MKLEKLFIDASIQSHPEAKRICKRIGLAPQVVDDPADMYRMVNQSSDPVRSGKKMLYLTRNKGNFVKSCPGTKDYTCCDYKILHVACFCTMDCAYCILQGYFHPPMLQFFVNREDMDTELDRLFENKEIARVGTGEFTDSLIWERWTDLTGHLVSRFAAQDRAVLELKTKTVNIHRLEGLDHRRRTILAWSLNTPSVIQSEERETASLEARLKAAGRCQDWGYPLAFHFDPLILYPGCEAAYEKVIYKIFAHIRPENIVWISLGTFRYMPALKPIIVKRFPESKIVYGEFITGLDNKMRYFKPLRISLYRQMAQWINALAPNVTVYFCMEDDEVWENALGFSPSASGGLGRMLDASAVRICGLKP